MFSSSITEEDIKAVNNKLTFSIIDDDGIVVTKQNETAEQWYSRNVALVGEEEAVKRFKAKANR